MTPLTVTLFRLSSAVPRSIISLGVSALNVMTARLIIKGETPVPRVKVESFRIN